MGYQCPKKNRLHIGVKQQEEDEKTEEKDNECGIAKGT